MLKSEIQSKVVNQCRLVLAGMDFFAADITGVEFRVAIDKLVMPHFVNHSIAVIYVNRLGKLGQQDWDVSVRVTACALGGYGYIILMHRA